MRDRIDSFIASSGTSEPFDDLARAVFAYQYERVPMYRRLCDDRAASPASIEHWQQIPALPVDAFKHGLTDYESRPCVFESSGTSAGAARSRHALSSLETYRASALAQFSAMVLPDAPGAMATLIIGPTAASHPRSSLGRMFSWCASEHSNGNVHVGFDEAGIVDLDGTVDWLEQAAGGTTPVLVLAVTSALSGVLDELRRRHTMLRLPADSRVVDTGGAKLYAARTRSGVGLRTLSPRALLKAVWTCLHVPAYLCINEYGMTEMLSQLYDDALESRWSGRLTPRAKVGPPWLRTSVVDPARLEPVGAGQSGLLRHLDLANWESVSALQTLDLGRSLGRGIELLGRAKGAEQRGCSQLLEGLTSRATAVER